MAFLHLFLGLILALLFANALLQVIIAVRWRRIEQPDRPLLKPVTLCAALARVRSSGLLLRGLRTPSSAEAIARSPQPGGQMILRNTCKG